LFKLRVVQLIAKGFMVIIREILAIM